jgi:hypothetical protein
MKTHSSRHSLGFGVMLPLLYIKREAICKRNKTWKRLQIVHCKCAAVALFIMNSKSGHLEFAAKYAKVRKRNKENVA